MSEPSPAGAGRGATVLPVLAAIGTAVLVGASMVATRFVIAETDPASLALLRYAIGVVCLAPAVLLGGRVSFAPRDVLPIALLGIGQFGILIALLNFGLQFMPAARGALIFATLPLMTMALAWALGYEAPTWPKALGVLLTILGVALALAEKATGDAGASWIGEFAIFACAACGAVCSVFYRPYLRKYPALPVSAFAMLASVLFLALPAAGEGFFERLPQFSPAGWAAVLFIGIGSGVGYYLWLWALQHTTPTRVTVFLSLNPFVATALGAWLLAERITPSFLAGLAAVMVGLWLAHWRREAA
jgi:drug/metabolite transporter (DMT)-like permease